MPRKIELILDGEKVFEKIKHFNGAIMHIEDDDGNKKMIAFEE